MGRYSNHGIKNFKCKLKHKIPRGILPKIPFVKVFKYYIVFECQKGKYFSWVFSDWLAGLTIGQNLLWFKKRVLQGYRCVILKIFLTAAMFSGFCLLAKDGYHRSTKFIWAISHLICLICPPTSNLPASDFVWQQRPKNIIKYFWIYAWNGSIIIEVFHWLGCCMQWHLNKLYCGGRFNPDQSS